MGEVVLNLLRNALKFTFDGTISVTLQTEDAHPSGIADAGTGVAAGGCRGCSSAFIVSPTRARSMEGSGIGLALVRELIGLHGGTITADSTEAGGTAFHRAAPRGDDHLPDVNVAPAAGPGVISSAADPFVEEALRWLPGGEGACRCAAPACRAGCVRTGRRGPPAPGSARGRQRRHA